MNRRRALSLARPLLLGIIVFFAVSSCHQEEEEDTASLVPPEENRFTTTVLTQPGQLDEPMSMTFLNDGRMLFVERKGGVKSFDPATKVVKTIGTIPVNTKYYAKDGTSREAEEGLMGIVAHPDYAKNHWVYMYYADPQDTKHVLARWEVHGDSLYTDTKKIVLEIPTQRELCCHTGGGMVFDKEGNLYLTVGNNTANPPAGTSNLDERPDMANHDDQRTAGNTNDLRGKILRIHPEDDGTYTIPEGNLFPKNTPKTRPEIYTMGHRNPWRISVDSKTGFIYWGEVGPDASKDSIIGPRGYDEFNQARKAGFFGWPYFIADNKPYREVDYGTKELGEPYTVDHVVNNSPNNTGMAELPTPEKAMIWYPYGNSTEFPLVGSSGRSATGGPVFRKADFKNAKRPFPSYFQGKWLIVEFMRGWIMTITMDKDGNYKSMEPFLPKENFSSAIDMQFSPDGDLYVLEYGSAWFRGNDNAQIVSIEYNGGNRKPVVKAKAEKLAGAIPFTVNLSSEGTKDLDNDALTYAWNIKSANGFSKALTEANPSVTLDKAGVYNVELTVTDSQGNKNSQAFDVKAGNEPPAVSIDIVKGNKSFFFPGEAIEYTVNVDDKEDGSLANNSIRKNEVAINFDYAPEGFDLIEIAQNHRSTDEWTAFSKGANLIAKSDCKSCHMMDKKSVGPSYRDVSAKYRGNAKEQERIAGKIISGGAGVWGEHAMSAHPQLSPADAALMVQYIISLTDPQAAQKDIAAKGRFVTSIPKDDNGRGGYLLRAAYKDKGTPDVGPLASEAIVALRNPAVQPEQADESKGTLELTTPVASFNMVGNGSYVGYNKLDLTGISNLLFLVQAQPRNGALGGVIEVHLDSPDGKLIGTTAQIVPKDVRFPQPPKPAKDAKDKKPQKAAPAFDFSSLRRLMAVQMPAQIEPTEGIHNIYFVCKNPDAGDNQIICQFVEIQFQKGK